MVLYFSWLVVAVKRPWVRYQQCKAFSEPSTFWIKMEWRHPYSVFWDRFSSHLPGWSKGHYVDQAVLKLTGILLSPQSAEVWGCAATSGKGEPFASLLSSCLECDCACWQPSQEGIAWAWVPRNSLGNRSWCSWHQCLAVNPRPATVS